MNGFFVSVCFDALSGNVSNGIRKALKQSTQNTTQKLRAIS
jgi:hypothetical protein